MRIPSLFLLLLLCVPALRAQNIHVSVPDSIDAEKFYMFYIHDDIVKARNMTPEHPEYGRYEYEEIVNRLSTEGYTVISYPREEDAHPYLYAEETAEGIRRLLRAGVPAKHISVVAAGRGAAIAVLILKEVAEPEINAVLLNACTDAFTQFWIGNDELMAGTVLSIYHPGDGGKSSCGEYFKHCGSERIPLWREIELGEQSSPGFYFRPGIDWVLPTLLWASGKYELVRQ